MAIDIEIEDQNEAPSQGKIDINIEEPQKPVGPSIKMNLEIRKSLDGSLIIYDHPEMDIVVTPGSNKVVAFPKNSYSDEVYAAQSRLLEHLTKAGVVARESVQAGNVFGAMEGSIQVPQDAKMPVIDLSVLSIGKFIEKEKPEYIFQHHYEQEIEDMYIDPSPEDSTPLGKVPQAANKGGVQAYDVRRYLAGL